MSASVTCPSCGAPGQGGSACRQCGAAIPTDAAGYDPLADLDKPAEEGLAWSWIGIGIVIILAAQVAVGFTLWPLILNHYVLVPSPKPWTAMLLLLLISAGIYFIGGLLVGRLSPGWTVKEPAIAAVTAALINAGLNKLVFRDSQTGWIGLLIAIVLCAVLGAAGGSAGETWQERARRRKAGKR